MYEYRRCEFFLPYCFPLFTNINLRYHPALNLKIFSPIIYFNRSVEIKIFRKLMFPIVELFLNKYFFIKSTFCSIKNSSTPKLEMILTRFMYNNFPTSKTSRIIPLPFLHREKSSSLVVE